MVAWYAARARPLAFRGTRDPYAILVSELMAQQTQVERAAEAWGRWMTRFPTVEVLASAPLGEVLRAWAGLGYNRRAVHLHRAAREIVERHAGRVPAAIEDLEDLPGVGPYTARAVASIAFGRPVGAVDTNVRRVLGRVVAGAPDVLRRAELQAVADAAVDPVDPGRWTHALMDLGASHCRPRPRCDGCPAQPWCRFAGDGSVTAARRASPAAGGTSRARPGTGGAAVPATTRWLRGRIVERLRDGDDWHAFLQPIGAHDLAAVTAAIEALARDGVVEHRVREDGRGLDARLPAT